MTLIGYRLLNFQYVSNQCITASSCQQFCATKNEQWNNNVKCRQVRIPTPKCDGVLSAILYSQIWTVKKWRGRSVTPTPKYDELRPTVLHKIRTVLFAQRSSCTLGQENCPKPRPCPQIIKCDMEHCLTLVPIPYPTRCHNLDGALPPSNILSRTAPAYRSFWLAYTRQWWWQN